MINFFGDRWDAEAMRRVAPFRSTNDLWAEDPVFHDLISRLRLGCSRFDAWWSTHDIGSAVSGTKTFHHPTPGLLCHQYATFQANHDEGSNWRGLFHAEHELPRGVSTTRSRRTSAWRRPVPRAD